jgi:hypothetical protein
MSRRGFRFSSEVSINTYVLLAMVVLALITIYLTYSKNSVSSFGADGDTIKVEIVNNSKSPSLTINQKTYKDKNVSLNVNAGQSIKIDSKEDNSNYSKTFTVPSTAVIGDTYILIYTSGRTTAGSSFTKKPVYKVSIMNTIGYTLDIDNNGVMINISTGTNPSFIVNSSTTSLKVYASDTKKIDLGTIIPPTGGWKDGENKVTFNSSMCTAGVTYN